MARTAWVVNLQAENSVSHHCLQTTDHPASHAMEVTHTFHQMKHRENHLKPFQEPPCITGGRWRRGRNPSSESQLNAPGVCPRRFSKNRRRFSSQASSRDFASLEWGPGLLGPADRLKISRHMVRPTAAQACPVAETHTCRPPAFPALQRQLKRETNVVDQSLVTHGFVNRQMQGFDVSS
jgi:hypothetical protein